MEAYTSPFLASPGMVSPLLYLPNRFALTLLLALQLLVLEFYVRMNWMMILQEKLYGS